MDCTIKHLGQAYVMHNEVCNGYPEYILGVIGHLAEASEECRANAGELSDKIRNYRLMLHENILTIVETETIPFEIPYFSLFKDCIRVIKEVGCGNCSKASQTFKDAIREAREEIKETRIKNDSVN